jgi:hypothetical protein
MRIRGFDQVSAKAPEIITDTMKPKFWTMIIRLISKRDKPMLRAAAPIKVAATHKSSIDT